MSSDILKNVRAGAGVGVLEVGTWQDTDISLQRLMKETLIKMLRTNVVAKNPWTSLSGKLLVLLGPQVRGHLQNLGLGGGIYPLPNHCLQE